MKRKLYLLAAGYKQGDQQDILQSIKFDTVLPDISVNLKSDQRQFVRPSRIACRNISNS